MRIRGVAIVVVAIVGAGCFSTARYESAHARRILDINARYADELRRQEASHAANLATLDELRGSLIPIEPGSSSMPLLRVARRADILECRSQRAKAPGARDLCQVLYVDALLRTYDKADMAWVTRELAIAPSTDIEALLAQSHNEAVLHSLDEQAASIAHARDQAHRRLELARENEIRASTRLRDAEIASGRAAHRARVKAVANTFTTLDNVTSPPE